MQGAAVIDSIEEKVIQGVTQQYYIINIPSSNLKLMVPQGKVSNTKIRLVEDKEHLSNVLDDFSNGLPDDSLSWKQKYDLNMKKLKSGELLAGAQVVRDLTLQGREKPLNPSEREMLDMAKRMFVGELSLIKGISQLEATELIDSALK
ncbi:transcription factor YdeB [Bacillus sp. AFS077874]|nr:transcription factor YdeB [Bacillus sp. AFS096315]PET77027.1 transcription factor YdeB [Bacillus sp. AFS001701]PFM82200.1 transcription factor YdeB [Bacillus sp. AFS077874]